MNPIGQEIARRIPKKIRVLRLLELAGARGCTTIELIQGGGGLRAAGRVDELRGLGYRITAKQEQGGTWRYTLVGTPPCVARPTMPPRRTATVQARLF